MALTDADKAVVQKLRSEKADLDVDSDGKKYFDVDLEIEGIQHMIVVPEKGARQAKKSNDCGVCLLANVEKAIKLYKSKSSEGLWLPAR